MKNNMRFTMTSRISYAVITDCSAYSSKEVVSSAIEVLDLYCNAAEGKTVLSVATTGADSRPSAGGTSDDSEASETAGSSSRNDGDGSGGSGPNIGAIVGGVIGGVVFCVIAAVLVWFIVRRKHAAAKNSPPVYEYNGHPELAGAGAGAATATKSPPTAHEVGQGHPWELEPNNMPAEMGGEKPAQELHSNGGMYQPGNGQNPQLNAGQVPGNGMGWQAGPVLDDPYYPVR